MNANTGFLSSSVPSPAWHRLRLFNYYRGVLALFFLTIHLNGWTEFLARPQAYSPNLFSTTAVLYIIAFVAFLPSIQQRWPSLENQAAIHTCVDIVVIVMLMHASGGVSSGLGMLLIVNISMTSLFLQRRITLLFAAATSLAILVSQAYSQMVISGLANEFAKAGFLGMLIFAFATMSSKVASQLRESEKLASDQERELETAVQLNERIIGNMRTGIMVVSSDGIIQMANAAAENLLGNTRLAPGTALQTAAPKLFDRLLEWQSSSKHVPQSPIQQSHGLPDIQPGFSRIEPKKGAQGRTLIFLEDASQLNQRFQQVKLASLGRLTASIAHEIRNPLAAIRHAAQLLDEESASTDDSRLTGIINTQVQRLNRVVENVLQLSRQQHSLPETIELQTWLNQFRDEFCTSHKLNSEQVVVNISPETTRILFDSSHLHQVFWNLCSNAINHAGIDIADLVINLKGGITRESTLPYVDIVDNGTGIREEVSQQIFEPFFTTSPTGTGLGLYITKEVIESNRAKIRHIELPTGTCFRIYFMPSPERPVSREALTVEP